VIGQDPQNRSTYRHQSGVEGSQYNNVTDPDQKAADFMGNLKNPSDPADIQEINYCCPCEEK